MEGEPAPPAHCWCSSLLDTCMNNSLCVEGRCVPRCDEDSFIQQEDCWCQANIPVCQAGQVCEEVFRDVVLCEDTRTREGWEELNQEVEEGITEFIEDRNYTFSCLNDFYLEDYVRNMIKQLIIQYNL